MVNRFVGLLLMLLASASGFGQVLNKGEYFFDTDPGIGNGTPFPFSSNASINTNFNVNINSLPTGFHNINIRLHDSNGNWSHFQTRSFYIVSSSAMPPGTTITKTEYFFDTDPGQGNGIPIAISASASINQNTAIPIASLTSGFHSLNIRSKDDKGRWSHFATRTFYIIPPIANTSAANLVKAEYFIDTDPGTGDAIAISITTGSTINKTIAVPTASLTAGFHTISIRTQDNTGKWSHFATRTFYLIPPSNFLTSTTLKKAEYFIDADPGIGNGKPLAISSANSVDNTFALDLTSVSSGFHRLAIRYQDNRGQWSLFEFRIFYIIPASSLGATNLTGLEYFIDVDPATNSVAAGKSVSITAAPSIDQTFALDLSGTPQGNHIMYVKAKDDKGVWSYAFQANFTILTCTPPTPPIAPTGSRCGTGTINLSASGASGTQVYRWYDDASTSSILFTGSTFTTASLNITRDFFVSIYDPNTLCESNRISTRATIKFAEKPIINPSGTISFCEGSSVILSAPAGFSQYKWSSGESTQQIFVNVSGKFAVQVGDGLCTGPTSDSVHVNVIAAPAKPVVQVTGNTTICGTGSVDLKGPDGVTYNWSNGATTQAITISQTGIYFLTTKTNGNCPSLPSDPVAVEVLTPPCTGGGDPTNQPPQVDGKPLSSQIEGIVTVDLTTLVSDVDNNIDFSSLRIINNETSRGVAAVIDASYFLTINYKGMPFTGTDRITLEVCDLGGACVQQIIDIDIVGQVLVYNGVTPDGDGFDDFMFIKYVDVVEGASTNTVTIFNRWGDEVYKVSNYNNTDRVFAGNTNSGSELPSGTYFYKINFKSGKTITGFITLKR